MALEDLSREHLKTIIWAMNERKTSLEAAQQDYSCQGQSEAAEAAGDDVKECTAIMAIVHDELS